MVVAYRASYPVLAAYSCACAAPHSIGMVPVLGGGGGGGHCCRSKTLLCCAFHLLLQVTMERSDVPGIDFVAFRTSSRSALSAALKLPIELRNAIKAELLPATSGSAAAPAGVSPVASTAVDGSGFFELRGLKPGLYVLKLSCDPAAAGGMSCEAWEMPVQVSNGFVRLVLLQTQGAVHSAVRRASLRVCLVCQRKKWVMCSQQSVAS